jgi:TatA/E family protein of Tat protein translocase
MSIGPAEIIIVLVIALLVFGPSRLPQMGRSLGRGVREFKKAADTAKTELGLGEVTDSINEIKSTFTEPLKEVTGTFDDLKASVDVKSAIEAPVATAAAAATATGATGVEVGPETPDVTPATVFADVTPPPAPDAPAVEAAEAPGAEAPVEAPAAETPVEAPEAPAETPVAAAAPAEHAAPGAGS